MRVLYIDIDTLRPDHLGCYGYHRETSPNIDTFASGALQFNNVHASDVPCLPSRTALLTGRFGIHNGVVNHGGTDADPAIEGESRGFWSRLHMTSFPNRLKRAGLKTVSISSFAQRHSAFHWYSGFDEAYDVGKYGLETADEVWAITDDWLTRNGKADDWFLHVHMWDPHTPYRAPAEFGEPFADDPIPSWLTEDVRAKHWQSCGPHSAREANGFAPKPEMLEPFPRQPQEIPNLQAVRQMFDGYDTGVLMSDHYVGQIFNKLADLNIDSDTVIMLSSDHGETLGELNVYGDHQTADQITTRVPLLLHWPGIDNTNKPLNAFHYQIDVGATILDLLGQRVPSNWDGESFAEALHHGRDEGRDYLVVSQGAWACQRGIRYDDYIYINTRHDAFHLYPDEMLFDVVNDPHQTNDLAASKPEVLARGKDLIATWLSDNAPFARGRDPHDNVMAEGGPFHVRGQLEGYLTRLRATDRSNCADELAAKWT